ncbi:MAG: hypothetical protein NW226_18025 [Microscillaceae bacterium]|nr:hypothetical protein [Microscillaceae bacterium]
MPTLKKFIALLISLAIIGAIFWGVYIAGSYMLRQYLSLNHPWNALLLINGFMMLLCTYWITQAIRKQSKQNKETPMPPEKVKAYIAFLKVCFAQVAIQGEKNNYVEDFLTDIGVNIHIPLLKTKLTQLSPEILLWASPAVLTQYLKLIEQLKMHSTEDKQVQQQAIEVLLEIRKEMGSGNEALDLKLLFDK